MLAGVIIMIEKRFDLGEERKFVESVLTKFEIKEIATDASKMKQGECTGYIELGGWEVRKGVRFFLEDVKPSGYQVTDAEALYCDIEKKNGYYNLYISEPGKSLKNEPLISTDTLDVKELSKCLSNLINESKKKVYEIYGVKPKKIIDLSVPEKPKNKNIDKHI